MFKVVHKISSIYAVVNEAAASVFLSVATGLALYQHRKFKKLLHFCIILSCNVLTTGRPDEPVLR